MIFFCCTIDKCFNEPCFWISTFVVPFLTFLVIQKLRPSLSITTLIKEEDCIKIIVENNSRYFDVNNLRIEICIYNENLGFTYHFEPDHTDFLILPYSIWYKKRDNMKTFVCRKAAESAVIILDSEDEEEIDSLTGFNKLILKMNEGYKLRVRCHAYNSFSGLGKSFEKVF